MLNSNVGIRHLQAFMTLSESLNFTQAAAELGITQSSLSRIIRRLETDMQVRLLDRTTRCVVLSDFGRRLHDEMLVLLARSFCAAASPVRTSPSYR